MRPKALYVETVIRTDLDTLWRHTQDPALHRRWDLRFAEISPIDGHDGHFRYASRFLGRHGHRRRGERGIARLAGRLAHVGAAVRLRRPAVADQLGRGFWRYTPVGDGVRFVTGFDYGTRWGRFGQLADRVFRPVFGWLTAWSFDRLRLWLETGIPPEDQPLTAPSAARCGRTRPATRRRPERRRDRRLRARARRGFREPAPADAGTARPLGRARHDRPRRDGPDLARPRLHAAVPVARVGVGTSCSPSAAGTCRSPSRTTRTWTGTAAKPCPSCGPSSSRDGAGGSTRRWCTARPRARRLPGDAPAPGGGPRGVRPAGRRVPDPLRRVPDPGRPGARACRGRSPGTAPVDEWFDDERAVPDRGRGGPPALRAGVRLRGSFSARFVDVGGGVSGAVKPLREKVMD